MDTLTDVEAKAEAALRDAALQLFDRVGEHIDNLTRALAIITQAVNEVERTIAVQRARFEDPNNPKRMN